MRIIVTGGAGFIGSHVAERLLDRGHEVAVVDDLSTGKPENIPEDVRFYERDIRSGCSEVFEEFGPEIVCHEAAQMGVRSSVRDPIFDAGVNVVGSLRILEDCVRYGVRKVVFASSGGAIYGEQREFPAPEGHPLYPVSPYGVSKLAGERYLHFYRVQYGLSHVALRYGNVYGPRQDPRGEAGVVAIFAGNLAEGKVSTINGTGEQTRDYVYIDDAVRATVLALEKEVPPGAYNVGTGVETSINRLYDMMLEISGKNIPPRRGPAKPGEQLRSSIAPDKALRELGWRPEVDLSAGLKETMRFFGAIEASRSLPGLQPKRR